LDWTGYTAVALIVWNAAVFALYGFDKRRAKRGDRRVSEKTLLLAAALMGGPGALAGMYVFRHKTKRAKFAIGVPLLLLMNTAVAVFIMKGI
jgi:uncharacterized membrane protein YsdA (DUF1294 family)